VYQISVNQSNIPKREQDKQTQIKQPKGVKQKKGERKLRSVVNW
jgi:hypothetical protein